MQDLGNVGQKVSHEENLMLSRRVREGDSRSRDKMIRNNVGLAYYHAIRVAELNKLHRQIDSEDILSAAVVGLIKAVDRYNPDLGFRFTTYARWWIRKEIGEELVRLHWVTMRPPKVNAEEYIIYKSDRISEEEREEYERRYVWGIDASIIDEKGEEDFTEYVQIMEAAEQCLDSSELELFQMMYAFDSAGAVPVGVALGLTPREVRSVEDRCLDKIREYMGEEK